jgi:hypothetical protein
MTRLEAFGWVLGIAAVTAGIWGACSSPIAPDGVVLTGSFGSEQGRLTATSVSSQFTGSCGSGNTIKPIMLDRHGNFNLIGTYGRPGTAYQTARFIGKIGSGTVTLRIVMGDSTTAVAPIVMQQGQQPSLAACK